MIALLEGHVKMAEAAQGEERIRALMRLIGAAVAEIDMESRKMGIEEADIIEQAARGVREEGTEEKEDDD